MGMTLYTNPLVRVQRGHVLTELAALPEASAHCVVTSPPYWGLRVYSGEQAQEWGDADGREHYFGQALGQEPSVEPYIDHLMQVMDALWRVLRDDGVCWVNLDDTRTSGGSGLCDVTRVISEASTMQAENVGSVVERTNDPALRPKDMALVPERFILGAQTRGWYVRSKVVWAPPSVMPESVGDRPTDAYQVLFMLTKSGRYWWDQEAVREPSPSSVSQEEYEAAKENERSHTWYASAKTNPNLTKMEQLTKPTSLAPPSGRNARNVQRWPTEGLGDFTVNGKRMSHFAAFPSALPRWCILASCPETCCGRCGAGYVRVVERQFTTHDGHTETKYNTQQDSAGRLALLRQGAREKGGEYTNETRTVGWKPGCSCPQDTPATPGVVLDPFSGSGTALLVAQELGRHAIGIELSADYVALTQHRLERQQPGLPLGGEQ